MKRLYVLSDTDGGVVVGIFSAAEKAIGAVVDDKSVFESLLAEFQSAGIVEFGPYCVVEFDVDTLYGA